MSTPLANQTEAGEAPASEAEPACEPKLIADLREANERLVLATLQAQELAEVAEAAQARAESIAERLQESERELRATAEFRERLLGIIGHDLRNPLGAIQMCAQLLVSEGHTDHQNLRNLAGFLLKSVRRMDRMIKQLFQFTRARFATGTPLELSPADLRPLCEHTIEELTLTSSVKIRAEYQGDTTGTWDGERLIEVLSNLIGNAIDYASPDTAVQVRVLGTQQDLVVEVINEGKPIPEDILPVLFLAFHRGRSGMQTKAGHLGLGLYIANEIVRMHGGTLTASSAAGLTTFVMRLPRAPRSSVSAPLRL